MINVQLQLEGRDDVSLNTPMFTVYIGYDKKDIIDVLHIFGVPSLILIPGTFILCYSFFGLLTSSFVQTRLKKIRER